MLDRLRGGEVVCWGVKRWLFLANAFTSLRSILALVLCIHHIYLGVLRTEELFMKKAREEKLEAGCTAVILIFSGKVRALLLLSTCPRREVIV